MYLKNRTLEKRLKGLIGMMLKRLLYLFMSNSLKNDAAANSIKAVPYTLTRGSLMFAMVIKLDIAHTVGHSRLMANPGKGTMGRHQINFEMLEGAKNLIYVMESVHWNCN